MNVYLVFKTHLDVGFTDYASTILDDYLYRYIPAAIELAEELRQRGAEERFVWTTGSWLIYEYLERADPDARARLEAAIERGDIRWHALPFTTHTELIDVSLMRFGLRLSQELDKRFGKTTIAAKMTDVPGHTRGLVPLLAEAGVRFLHLGVNGASPPPEVPEVFRWRDEASDSEVIVMYQKGGYGDLVLVPGLEQALAFAHTEDNQGPQTAEQVVANYAKLKQRLPGAAITAASMDDFALHLEAIRDQLPVVSSELGDTWIHGVGSDPLKVSHYRALMRLRKQWIESGRLGEDDPALMAFSRQLLMVPEHTWGMDEKVHLADYEAYNGEKLRAALQTERFQRFAASWEEQRAYLRDAIAALADSQFAAEAKATLSALAAAQPDLSGFTQLELSALQFENAQLKLAFDSKSGALIQLVDKNSQRDWVAPERGFGTVCYQSFDDKDYQRFYNTYNINHEVTAHWSVDDYTKPGIERAGALSGLWSPTLQRAFQRVEADGTHLLLELRGAEQAVAQLGCPRQFWLEYFLPNDRASFDITLQWFGKAPTRLPEALWFDLQPLVRSDGAWRLRKLGQWIDPRDVVSSGNRSLHAVEDDIRYADAEGSLTITTWDAPLVAPGKPSLLDFPNTLPEVGDGVHINLFNNVWGTNFRMWYDEDTRFRFQIQLGSLH